MSLQEYDELPNMEDINNLKVRTLLLDILGFHLSPAWVTLAMSLYPALLPFLHLSQWGN